MTNSKPNSYHLSCCSSCHKCNVRQQYFQASKYSQLNGSDTLCQTYQIVTRVYVHHPISRVLQRFDFTVTVIRDTLLHVTRQSFPRRTTLQLLYRPRQTIQPVKVPMKIKEVLHFFLLDISKFQYTI